MYPTFPTAPHTRVAAPESSPRHGLSTTMLPFQPHATHHPWPVELAWHEWQPWGPLTVANTHDTSHLPTSAPPSFPTRPVSGTGLSSDTPSGLNPMQTPWIPGGRWVPIWSFEVPNLRGGGGGATTRLFGPSPPAGAVMMSTTPPRLSQYDFPPFPFPVGAVVVVSGFNPDMATYRWTGTCWYNSALGHRTRTTPTPESFARLFMQGSDGQSTPQPPPSEPRSPSPPPPPPPPACGICQDNSEPLVVSRQLRVTESFQDRPCDGGAPHEFCRGCLASWIASEVESGKSAIRCPAVGCTCRLCPEDINRLADVSVAARFRQLMTDHISGKTRDLMADPVHAEWLRENTKACPRCHQLIERISGCDDMVCMCGEEFCYGCGKSRSDLRVAAARGDVPECQHCIGVVRRMFGVVPRRPPPARPLSELWRGYDRNSGGRGGRGPRDGSGGHGGRGNGRRGRGDGHGGRGAVPGRLVPGDRGGGGGGGGGGGEGGPPDTGAANADPVAEHPDVDEDDGWIVVPSRRQQQRNTGERARR